MLGGVAVADGDGIVLEGIEVDGDAEGGADFVHAAVAAADGAGSVPEDIPAAFEFLVKIVGFFDDFWVVFYEREDGGFDGGEAGMEFEEGTFFPVDFVFAVGGADDGEEEAVDADGGLDDVGEVAFFAFFVEIFEGFSAKSLMLR